MGRGRGSTFFLKKDRFRNSVLSASYRNDRRGAKHRKLLPSLETLFFATWKWLKKSASVDETHIPGRVLSTWTSHFCSHWSYPLGIHANSYPHRGTRGWGGGGVMEPGGIGGTPPWSFWCCSISKRLCLQWKAFDLLNKMRYILRVSWYCWGPVTSPTVLANLAAILDFTNN